MASWPQVAEQNHGTRWNEFEEKTPSDPNKIWGPRAACTLLGNLGFLKTLPSVVKLTDFMCRWDQWWLILVAVLVFLFNIEGLSPSKKCRTFHKSVGALLP